MCGVWYVVLTNISYSPTSKELNHPFNPRNSCCIVTHVSIYTWSNNTPTVLWMGLSFADALIWGFYPGKNNSACMSVYAGVCKSASCFQKQKWKCIGFQGNNGFTKDLLAPKWGFTDCLERCRRNRWKPKTPPEDLRSIISIFTLKPAHNQTSTLIHLIFTFLTLTNNEGSSNVCFT